MTGLKVCRTSLFGEAHAQKAVDASPFTILPCDLVLKAIGYKSVSISDSLPFDTKKHVVKNAHGRVVDDGLGSNSGGDESKTPVYVTGWLKRGPSGIIGTNIGDARETVQCIVEDMQAGKLRRLVDPWEEVRREQVVMERGIENRKIDWTDYEQLNAEEVGRGEKCDPPKPRQKILGVEEVMKILGRQ
ncbi:hypothetical protein EON65_55105 [archaeon]|nr:MAG: hypothetical protein EON65_55105 [archaeon]